MAAGPGAAVPGIDDVSEARPCRLPMAQPARPVAIAKSKAATPAAARRLVSRLSELLRAVTVGEAILVFFSFARFVAVGVTLDVGVPVTVADPVAVAETVEGVGLAARAPSPLPAAKRKTTAETDAIPVNDRRR